MILTVVWELHWSLMIQNLKDSRVYQNSCYMLTKPVKVILVHFVTKKDEVHYAGRIEDNNGTDNKELFLW